MREFYRKESPLVSFLGMGGGAACFVIGGGATEKYWISVLDNTTSTGGTGVVSDSSGNVYVASQGDNKALLVKYDASGGIVWQRTLSDSTGNDDEYYDVALDDSGNVYVVNPSYTNSTLLHKILVAKYNSSGVIQWQNTMDGSGSTDDNARDVAVDSSGNVYVISTSYSSGAGSSDFLLVKYNTSGVVQWQRTLGNSDENFGQGVAVDNSSGDVYVTGLFYPSNNKLALAKYNSSGTIQWQRALYGTDSTQGTDVVVDSSGNVYVTGTVGSDALIAKYNSSGTIQWQRTLSGTGSDYGQDLGVDSSGNVYLFGMTTSGSSGGFDFLIAKYNSSGVIQWQRTLSTVGTDYGRGISVDGKGNLYLAGTSNSKTTLVKIPDDGSLTGEYASFTYEASSLTDAASSMTETSGSLTDASSSLADQSSSLTDAASSFTPTFTRLEPWEYWVATLGGSPRVDSGRGVSSDSSGNVYVAGQFFDKGLIAKYDAYGALQWQKKLAGSSNTQAYDISVDSSGNAYVTGMIFSSPDQLFIAKYNTSGALQWQRTLSDTNSVYGDGVAVDSSGNVYTVGYIGSTGDYDLLLAKYNSSGTIQWQRTLSGGDYVQGFAVDTDSSGNVYVAGEFYDSGAGDVQTRLFVAKYNSSGTIQWQRTLTDTVTALSEEEAYGISVDSSGNVYLAGHTGVNGAGDGLDFLIVKYNTSGVIQWQRKLSGSDNDFRTSSAVDSLGNVYISGTANSQATNVADFFIAKYNSSGTIQWQLSLTDTNIDNTQDIAIDGSDNVLVVGSTSQANTDLMLAKLPNDASITGTNGDITIATRSFTDASTSLTDAAGSLTDAAGTLTDAAGTLTSSNVSRDSATTQVG